MFVVSIAQHVFPVAAEYEEDELVKQFNSLKNSYKFHEMAIPIQQSLDFIANYKIYQPNLTYSRSELRDVWKVYFNAANLLRKQRHWSKAAHLLGEISNLHPYHAPIIWWRIYATHAMVRYASRNITEAAELSWNSCYHAALEEPISAAIKHCDNLRHVLISQESSDETENVRRISNTVNELKVKSRKFSVDPKINIRFKISALDNERNMDRNFAFIRDAARRLTHNSPNLLHEAEFCQSTLDVSFVFDDCGVYGWREQLGPHSFHASSIRIRWEDECPKVYSGVNSGLCHRCVQKSDVFMFAYKKEMNLYEDFARDRVLVHGPQSASPQLFYSPIGKNDARNIDVLLTGFTEGIIKQVDLERNAIKEVWMYPLRRRISQLAKRTTRGTAGFNISVREHPGYGNCTTSKGCATSNRTKYHSEHQLFSYAMALRHSKIVIVTSSSRDYSLRKYVEGAMAGALLVGDIPSGEPNYSTFVVNITNSQSDDDILGVITWWLNHDQERRTRARIGQRYMVSMAKRTWESFVKAAIGGSILFMRKRPGVYSFDEAVAIYRTYENERVSNEKIAPSLSCSGLYHGWFGHNAGDDGMLSIFLALFNRALFRAKSGRSTPSVSTLIKSSKAARCQSFLQDNMIQFVILGGGSVVHEAYLNNIRKSTVPKFIFGSGWDDYNMLFGEHITIDSLMRPSNITYLSHDNPHLKRELDLLRHLFGRHNNVKLYGGVRGPITSALLAAAGLELPTIYDSGLLAGHIFLDEMFRGVKFEQSQTKYIIINFGESPYHRVYGGRSGMLQVQEKLVQTAKQLQARGYRVLFVPTWKHDIAINRQLAERSKTDIINEILGIEKLLKLMGYAELVIGVRLHSAIFAASTGTPFLLFSYRLKAFDFISSLYAQLIVDALISYDISISDLQNKIDAMLSAKKLFFQSMQGVVEKVNSLYVEAIDSFVNENDQLKEQCSALREQEWCLEYCPALNPRQEGFVIIEKCLSNVTIG